MKKYLSKIFAIYILILSLFPCTDINSDGMCFSNENIHIEQSSHQNEHCKDMCSPLCVCLCCNEVISVNENFSFVNIQNYSTIEHSENLQSKTHFLESTSPPPKV